ncbi:hypothetical protein [Parendozoicomonas haliclonae]|uniref:hypothetical protein n=1 Tax=Parendozoicomonas haliclonae TaxID=1960125 RepID=UPI001055A545|nr:hypothetical protein [Parendozoicomonas haliclonae]
MSSLKKEKPNQEVINGINFAVATLTQQNVDLEYEEQSLEILRSGHILSNQDINHLLADSYGKSGAYIYARKDTGPYTMSAQGIDKAHYLVNSYLEGYLPFHVNNVMMPLYVLSKRKRYVLDANQYQGRSEVWQSSRQAFLYPRGDCEDHAIALADWLIEMNHDARVVVGDMDGGGHAWVILFKNGKEYLLEATLKSGVNPNKSYPLASLHKLYHPEYMFNRDNFWVNTGTKFTTDYSGDHWEKASIYKGVKALN